jgi:hypothetical protein
VQHDRAGGTLGGGDLAKVLAKTKDFVAVNELPRRRVCWRAGRFASAKTTYSLIWREV